MKPKYKDFEDFLVEKHAEEYVGTKDGMIEDFERWLCDLDVDTIIKYANIYAIGKAADMLEECNKSFKDIMSKVRP